MKNSTRRRGGAEIKTEGKRTKMIEQFSSSILPFGSYFDFLFFLRGSASPRENFFCFFVLQISQMKQPDKNKKTRRIGG